MDSGTNTEVTEFSLRGSRRTCVRFAIQIVSGSYTSFSSRFIRLISSIRAIRVMFLVYAKLL